MGFHGIELDDDVSIISAIEEYETMLELVSGPDSSIQQESVASWVLQLKGRRVGTTTWSPILRSGIPIEGTIMRSSSATGPYSAISGATSTVNTNSSGQVKFDYQTGVNDVDKYISLRAVVRETIL